MSNSSAQPRILFVSPDVIFIPNRSEYMTRYMVTLSEGFSDDLAGLIVDLYDLGVDVHVVQPDYRQIFTNTCREEQSKKVKKMPPGRIHLTEDRAFFYSNYADSNYKWENIKISLAFQREVMNYILPWIQPDLIHCHDWMTGLIPAAAKKLEIPCLFTVHKPDTAKSLLASVEDMGIDAATFWQYLFYDRYPANYEETRETNPVNFLLSGILAAPVVTIVGFASLMKREQNLNPFTELPLSKILVDKLNSGAASIHHTQSFNLHHYLNTYEWMLHRPLINIHTKNRKSRSMTARIAA